MTEQYGWVWNPVPKHLCSPPNRHDLDEYWEGALWRCAECDQYWEVYLSDETARKDMRLISPVSAALRMGKDPGLLVDLNAPEAVD